MYYPLILLPLRSTWNRLFLCNKLFTAIFHNLPNIIHSLIKILLKFVEINSRIHWYLYNFLT